MLLFFLIASILLSLASAFSGWPTCCRHNSRPLFLVSGDRSASFDSGEFKKSTERREVLASILVLGSGSVAITASSYNSLSSNPPSVEKNGSLAATATLLSSVDEALTLIESSCDRRFLHGVVASDYRLMYRGMSPEDAILPSVRSEPSDLLLPSTYDSRKAADFFSALDEKMKSQPVKPSNGHLATTSSEAAKVWGGEAVSIWPLGDNVHFAWLAEGGDFWANESRDVNALKVIVDGVDCGRMSLEDALERKNAEILFRADQFLAVPVSQEKKLLEGLKNAFII